MLHVSFDKEENIFIYIFIFILVEDISLESGDWAMILSNIQFPELNLSEFLEEAQQQGAYLTLYTYLQQKLPLTVDIKEEQALIWKVLDWSAKGKSWWDKFLILIYSWWKQLEVNKIDELLELIKAENGCERLCLMAYNPASHYLYLM